MTFCCSPSYSLDADRSNVELARLTGLSPAATLHRVRALKESGVIRIIRAQPDPALAGFPLQVFITCSLFQSNPRSDKVFEDHLRSLPQVITADNVAGETDYILTAVARDVTELARLLASLSSRGTQRLVTYLRLAEVKAPAPLPRLPRARRSPTRTPRARPLGCRDGRRAPSGRIDSGGERQGAGSGSAAVSR